MLSIAIEARRMIENHMPTQRGLDKNLVWLLSDLNELKMICKVK